MKIRSFFVALALASIVALPARAQNPTPDGFGGCEDSPENPTLILAGLAGGAFALNALRLRVRARRSASNSK